jgi:hypothetical protein
VAAVRAEEDVPATAAMLGGAYAAFGRQALGLRLAGEQGGQERRQVNRQAGLPGRGAVGVVLGRQPVEDAAELAELPLDVDRFGVEVLAFQADRLTPPHTGVANGDDHGEVVVAAGQQRGAFGYQ